MPTSFLQVPERVAIRALTSFRQDAGGCHISTYSTASHGYAQIGWQGTRSSGAEGTLGTTAHRAAWVAVNGQIPPGMTVDHKCRNRRCVNPEHLQLLSNEDNARGSRGSWQAGPAHAAWTAAHAAKRSSEATHCPNGHAYTPETELPPGGTDRCRPCRSERQRRYRNRKINTTTKE